jgi:hypothetical protein
MAFGRIHAAGSHAKGPAFALIVTRKALFGFAFSDEFELSKVCFH